MIRRTWIAILILAVLLFALPQNIIRAENAETVGFNEISDAEKIHLLSSLQFKRRDKASYPRLVQRFDVSESGKAALCLGGLPQHEVIAVYDLNGAFLYEYTFSAQEAYVIDWCERDNLRITFNRSGKSIVADESGRIVKVEKIESSTQGTDYIGKRFMQASVQNSLGAFSLKRPAVLVSLIASGYSQVVYTDTDGDECLIYEAPLYWWLEWVVGAVFLAPLAALGLRKGILLKKTLNRRK